MQENRIKESVEKWVNSFQAIPQTLIQKAYTNGDLARISPSEGENCLPMWGWLWLIDDISDSDWMRGNIETVAELGFDVFESDDGLFLGIDGAGYDFYGEHWIPLYKARGLQWHKN